MKDPSEDRGIHLGLYFRLALFAAISAGFYALYSSKIDPVDNEFFNLYAGAKIGPRNLYDPHAFAQVAASLHAKVLEARFYYTRMPYFAILTRPLGWLSLPVGLAFWRTVQALAIAVSVWLWPGAKSTMASVALVSLPAIWVVSFAQDVGLVLFFVAASVALEKRNRPFLAGVVFSLCLGKPHLVIFVPLVMLVRRDFRFLAGATLGALSQILLSFAVAPATWPYQWLSVLANPQMHPYVNDMPGLRALTQTTPGVVLAVLIAISLAVAVWRSAALEAVEKAVAIAMAAGIVANLHSYAVDCILLIPAITIALASRRFLERALGLFLATPIPFLAMLAGHTIFLQTGLVVLVHLHASWARLRAVRGLATG